MNAKTVVIAAVVVVVLIPTAMAGHRAWQEHAAVAEERARQEAIERAAAADRAAEVARLAEIARVDQEKLSANRASLLDSASHGTPWWAGTWRCDGVGMNLKFTIAPPLTIVRWSHHVSSIPGFVSEDNASGEGTITALYSGIATAEYVDNTYGERKVLDRKSVPYVDIKTNAKSPPLHAFRLARHPSERMLLEYEEQPPYVPRVRWVCSIDRDR